MTTAPFTVSAAPRAKGLPLVGVLPSLLRDPAGALSRIAARHPGEVVSLSLGPAEVFLVTKPDHVQCVLQDSWRSFHKGGVIWKEVRRLTGEGLATNDGASWFRNRRLMQPLFTTRHIDSLVHHMIRVVESEIERAAREAEAGAHVDMGKEMLRLTQGVVLETIFSSSMSREERESVGDALCEAFRQIGRRIFFYFLPDWVPLPGDQALRRSIRTIDESLLRIIAERRRTGEDRGDLLSLLLQAQDDETGTRLSDRQLRDEVVTMFVGGNETTSTALTWTWHLISKHPRVEHKLRQEIDAVLGGRAPTGADLADLTYTRMVFHEAMRLYPPGWLLPRVAAEDTMIDRHPIPSGAIALLCPYVTQRDPSLWERPSEFDPERFSPERSRERHRYAFFPFGGGARQCIGAYMATVQAQIVIAMMVQRFRVLRVPGRDVEMVAGAVMRPRDSLLMRLEPIRDRA